MHRCTNKGVGYNLHETNTKLITDYSWISNFRRALYVIFFCVCVCDSPASEFYVSAFRKTKKSVPKRQHIKFRRRRITQKKEYYNRLVKWEHRLKSLLKYNF